MELSVDQVRLHPGVGVFPVLGRGVYMDADGTIRLEGL